MTARLGGSSVGEDEMLEVRRLRRICEVVRVERGAWRFLNALMPLGVGMLLSVVAVGDGGDKEEEEEITGVSLVRLDWGWGMLEWRARESVFDCAVFWVETGEEEAIEDFDEKLAPKMVAMRETWFFVAPAELIMMEASFLEWQSLMVSSEVFVRTALTVRGSVDRKDLGIMIENIFFEGRQ